MKKIKCFFAKSYVHMFFLTILVVGFCTFRDYGIYIDESLQRTHSLISYYKVKSFVHGKSIDYCGVAFNKDDPIEKFAEEEHIKRCISKYVYKYYGVAMQMPLVFIEDIFNFKLSFQTIFYIRHLYTFLIFFLGLVFLYKIMTNYIIKDKKYALAAVLFMVLSPHMYGEAFYNIKDSLFMSISVINLYFIFKYLKNSNLKNLIVLCFISALVINSRVVGGIYIAVALLYNIIYKRKDIKKMLKSSLLMTSFTYIFYILITPASWANPLTFPFEAIKFFFNYLDPISKTNFSCLHFGKVYLSTNLPWHYLPVWIFITTPLLYIVLFLLGIVTSSSSVIKKIIDKKIKSINFELLFVNIILIFMLLFVIITRPTLYAGWRHLYFLYPLIIIDCIVGLKVLFNIKYLKKFVLAIVIINSILLTIWMIKNHPYQYEYYEYPLRDKIIKNFGMNFYKVSNVDAIKYILNHDKRKIIKVITHNNDNVNYIKMVDDYKRIEPVYDIYDADYIISNHLDDKNKYGKYTKIYTKKIDNKYTLFTIYK